MLNVCDCNINWGICWDDVVVMPSLIWKPFLDPIDNKFAIMGAHREHEFLIFTDKEPTLRKVNMGKS